MSTSLIDHLTRKLTGVRTRRTLAQGLAALPLASAWGFLPADDVDARRKRRRNQPQAERRNRKKTTLCLNGETIKVKRAKKKKYIRQGAASGACETCGRTCPPGQRCCGTTCIAGTWVNQTAFGSFGSGPSQFDYPNGIAISPDGLTAWIADAQNNRIAIWTRPDANSTAWASTAFITTPGAVGVGGVRVSADTLTMWITDQVLNRVFVWTRPATSAAWLYQTAFGTGGGSGATQFADPGRAALSPDGLTFWIADWGNNRVSIWSRTSATSTSWNHQVNFGTLGSGNSNLDHPQSVAVAPDGLMVWIADTENHRVSIWTRPNAGSTTWSPQTTFGSLGTGPNNLDRPLDVTVSPDGLTVWIADNGNQRVSIWTRSNATSTAWANTGTFGNRCVEIALSADYLTAWLVEPGQNRITVWSMTCPA
jgi:DNA-binding beta-propeller fold protein YncE